MNSFLRCYHGKNIGANDFTLTISFDNGEKRLYDMRALLKKGTVFEPFLSLENFRRVYVDDTHCIAWDIDPNVDSNKVDLCPDGCYIDSIPVGDVCCE